MLGSNIDAFLGKKYAILGEQANTAQAEGMARARQTDVTTQLAPGLAAATEAQGYGAAAAGQGAGALSRTNASLAPSIAGSENAMRGAQSNLFGAQGFGIRQLDSFAPGSLGDIGLQRASQGFGGGNPADGGSVGGQPAPSASNGPPARLPPGWHAMNTEELSTGTAKVPGQGSGKVDTQPAVLAPGEAVLNKAAAEHLGRGTIELLNALGRQKMGMPDDQAQGGQQVQGNAAPQQGPDAAPSHFAGGGIMSIPSAWVTGVTDHYNAGPLGGWGQQPIVPGPGRGDGGTAGRAGVYSHTPVAGTGPGGLGAPQPMQTLGAARSGGLGAPQQMAMLGGPQPMQHFAGGTAAVGAKGPAKGAPGKAAASAKGDAKKPAAKGAPKGGKADPMGGLTPGILAALVQMGGAGGSQPMGGAPGGMGMPPGGAPPMPMPMPQAMPQR